MASSDEEGEIIPDCITNYCLVDYKEEPISFSRLPLQWSEDEISDDLSMQIFLRGTADGGLQQIYKKVIAWKFELSYVLPEIYLLSKDKTWIKLLKPRKSFESTIKTILITIHCLHFMKTNQEASRNAVWNHLLKAFSSYEIEPSENDLLDHLPLINEAAIRDKEIAKSEYFAALLVEPGKRKAFHEDIQTTKKSKFIVDSDDDDDGDEDDDAHEFDERVLFDSVCALCDNGGELLCCEGRCTRSFHATVDAGADSLCESLGYTDAQVEAFQNFLCKNCQYQRHQCFVCGILGSSNKSPGAEVFPCVSATCGHFYHPKCVAKLFHPCDETQAEAVQKKIAAGESFICPAHKCFICKQGEDKKVYDLQFALCRRCPKAYHRKCLPRKIAFEGDGDKNIHQRAWDGLLPNRILIYCMDHKIVPVLATPERNHILFPGIDGKKKKHRIESLSGKEKVMAEKRSTVSVSVTERTAAKMPKKLEYAAVTGGESPKELEKGFSRQGSTSKVTDVTMKSLRTNNLSVQARVCKLSTADKNKSSFGIDHSLPIMRSNTVKPKQQNFLSGKTKSTIAAMPVMKKVCITRPLGDEEEKRIVALMKRSTASFDLEEFIKNQRMLSNNADACSSRFVVDKTMTKGRVEAYVRAIPAALKRLEEGCTTGDAKEVCGPEILKQIVSWKGKLKVYLAPFLHGMRYTSFGRHFTKLDKLKEIVDRLHWYVQDGDMIVDFCCGSNDFSCLLSEKLEQMGKSCSFRNYDLIQSKNDFNFEKRDWMSVRVEELPAGSQLIMGLNPPFGVHASRANQFIEKALKFKPKLLILIVPRETKRLDEKNPPYDLIWEDGELLSGKSFYLPGSVDVHEQQMEQWNWKAPPLYLWSRSDWTAQHKTIARNRGHLSKEQAENVQKVVSNYLMEENQDCYGDFSDIMNGCGDISRILDDVPEDSDDNEGARANVPNMQQVSPSPLVDGCGGPPLEIDEMYMDMELSTPPNFTCNDTRFKSLSECQPEVGLETPAEANAGQQDFEYLQPNLNGHGLQFGTEYTMFHTAVPNAVGSSYNWSTSTSYGVGGRSLNVGDKYSDYVEYAVENIGQSRH
ncbi:Protein ENHANCED DOWNY MILDEW 2 [Camellia lanceoleosa]|uniref:Protein ENHANCED DOWNY MILDEW 2 n=1 Tax=Camellia lanceoleosa TaxID=1840588 RepID=A0ACC0HFA3_9ERIC|nr:Protein ENHANCED DOWNY MILDEW 2 [Camellia lanceoleosa]